MNITYARQSYEVGEFGGVLANEFSRAIGVERFGEGELKCYWWKPCDMKNQYLLDVCLVFTVTTRRYFGLQCKTRETKYKIFHVVLERKATEPWKVQVTFMTDYATKEMVAAAVARFKNVTACGIDDKVSYVYGVIPSQQLKLLGCPASTKELPIAANQNGEPKIDSLPVLHTAQFEEA